jgi:hypothetical protein
MVHRRHILSIVLLEVFSQLGLVGIEDLELLLDLQSFVIELHQLILHHLVRRLQELLLLLLDGDVELLKVTLNEHLSLLHHVHELHLLVRDLALIIQEAILTTLDSAPYLVNTAALQLVEGLLYVLHVMVAVQTLEVALHTETLALTTKTVQNSQFICMLEAGLLILLWHLFETTSSLILPLGYHRFHGLLCIHFVKVIRG